MAEGMVKIDVAQVPQQTPDFQDLRHLLAEAVRSVVAKQVLEIGTDVGDTARIFSALLQETGGQLYTVDVTPPKNNWPATWPLKNLTFIQADARTLAWSQLVDLLFLDALPSYEGTLQLLQALGPYVRPGGKILVHNTLHQEHGAQVLRALHEWTVLTKLPWTHYPFQRGLGIIDLTYQLAPTVRSITPLSGAGVGK